MIDSIKKYITDIGGMEEYKKRRQKIWEENNQKTHDDIKKIIDHIPSPQLKMRLRHDLTEDLLLVNRIKLFIDLNLIEEVKEDSESYETILFRALNNYIEQKKE